MYLEIIIGSLFVLAAALLSIRYKHLFTPRKNRNRSVITKELKQKVHPLL